MNQKKTKVCHVTSVHKSQDVRILKKQCTSLAKEGYETYLVARGDSYIENGVNVIGIGYDKISRKDRMLKISKLIVKKALELDCDIYHLHDPELLMYVNKIKKYGKKIIFDSHENYTLQIKEKVYLPKFIRISLSKVYEFYQNHIFQKLDGLIFPCLLNGQNIFEGKSKNIAIIGNEPLLSELYDKYELKEEFNKIDKSVVYVGGITKNRGIVTLMEATNKSNSTLKLGGKINDKFNEELKSYNSYSCIDYRGLLNRDEVLNVYKESYIGACTLLNVGQYNMYDNFATKVYEYMSVGLPVILSRYQYSEKINQEYNFAILVDPNSVEEISDAINYLTQNPEEAKELGKNGRRAIIEKFNWEIEEKKLIEFYQKIV